MPTKNTNSLSIILPAYRQEKTIDDDIKRLEKYLKSLGLSYELIVVVDGIEDDTYKKALKHQSKRLKVYINLINSGKGSAVRYGMLKAKGDIIGFIDAGMDLDLSGIGLMLDYMSFRNADIIIGSKLHPDSVVSYPFQRKVLSWGYRLLTRLLFGFAVRDTQVGLKLFRRRVVRDVFPLLVVKRFAFDVEVLAVSYARGYKKIYEAPIKITFNWGSTIANFTSNSFWKAIFSMLSDTFAVYYRLKIAKYYSKKKVVSNLNLTFPHTVSGLSRKITKKYA